MKTFVSVFRQNKNLQWMLNCVFWAAFVLVVFCGCALVTSGLGAVVVSFVPNLAPFVRVIVIVASVLLTPVAMAGIALLTERG